MRGGLPLITELESESISAALFDLQFLNSYNFLLPLSPNYSRNLCEVDSAHCELRSTARALIESLCTCFLHVEEKTGTEKGQKSRVSYQAKNKVQCNTLSERVAYDLQYADENDAEKQSRK